MTLKQVKALAWVGVLMPLVFEIGAVVTDNVGADPAKQIVHYIGQTSIWLLLLALLATPLRDFLRVRLLLKARRIIGVAAFSYGLLHLLAYSVFILGLDWAFLAEELSERPYITAGMASLLLMLPLAITSTDGWVHKLKQKWRRLHRLVYPAAAIGVVHVWWQARSDIGFALLLAALLGVLLLLRWQPVRAWLLR